MRRSHLRSRPQSRHFWTTSTPAARQRSSSPAGSIATRAATSPIGTGSSLTGDDCWTRTWPGSRPANCRPTTVARSQRCAGRWLPSTPASRRTASVNSGCQDAQRKRPRPTTRMRAALVSCFVEYGNQLQFEGATIDRGTALQLLHVVGRTRAAQGAVRRVRPALDGAQRPQRGRQPLSPHDRDGRGRRENARIGDRRRGARDRRRDGGGRALARAGAGGLARREPAGAGRALGLSVTATARPIASCRRDPGATLLPVNERFYRDLGADLPRSAWCSTWSRARTSRRSPTRISSPAAGISDGDVAAAGRAGRWHVCHRRAVLAQRTGARERPRRARQRHPHAARLHGLARHAVHGGVRRRAVLERPRAVLAAPLPGRRGRGGGLAARAVSATSCSTWRGRCSRCACCSDPRADPNAVWTDITIGTCASCRTRRCRGGRCACSSRAIRATWSTTVSARC